MTIISAIVLTKNEEKNIVDCLESLQFVNEIIIIDDESTDRTVELSKRLGAKVITRALKNFSDQRNFALQEAKGDWILYIDADERISDELKREIIDTTDLGDISGYYLRRDDYMWEKQLKHGEVKSIKVIRLAKKMSGKWSGKVHEKWNIKGKVGLLQAPLIHIPHPTVSEFLKKIDHYTTLRSEELNEDKARSGLASIILYPVSKFMLNYFINKGYKDGTAGFIYAMMMSFHSFLVRSKLFLLQEK